MNLGMGTRTLPQRRTAPEYSVKFAGKTTNLHRRTVFYCMQKQSKHHLQVVQKQEKL